MVISRITWSGDEAWVKMSDSEKTALNDDNLASAAGSLSLVPGMPPVVDVIGPRETDASECSTGS